LLIAEIHAGKAISLAAAIRPLEIIEQAPGVEGADIRTVGDGARQFRQFFAEEFDAPRAGHSAIFFFVW
jgi:hypothetical protein